jgi:phosphate starvation-inducible protein PhoH
MYYACQSVLNGDVKGIVIVKDLRDADGFLPGDIWDKYIPKAKQLLTYAECFLQCDYQTLLNTGTIVIQPLAYIQGTDYTNFIMVVDEAELITPELMYSICSRGATRIFINGDTSPMQSTAKHIKQGKDGLSFLLQTMDKSASFGMVTMDKEEDIVRDPYIREVIINMQPKLEEFKARKVK